MSGPVRCQQCGESHPFTRGTPSRQWVQCAVDRALKEVAATEHDVYALTATLELEDRAGMSAAIRGGRALHNAAHILACALRRLEEG